MKQTAILFALVLAGIAACDSLVSNIDGVKSGRLGFDKAATIGDTFDSYKWVQQPGTWTESTERGKTFVTWTAKVQGKQPDCVIDVSSRSPALGCDVTGSIVVTFAILPDDALEVANAEAKTHATAPDGKKVDEDHTLDGMELLQAIYSNEPPARPFRYYPGTT